MILYMACIFCDILSAKAESSIIYRDDTHCAFLDRYPIDVGHCLVIPIHHHEMITDMTPKDVGELFALVSVLGKKIISVTGASGFNVAQNNGRVARQIVPHVHVHLIPRYASTGAVCPKCKSSDLSFIITDIIDYISLHAAERGVTVEVISGKSEYGVMLESLGSVGAILRYNPMHSK